MGIFTPSIIGIDLYDMPLTAVCSTGNRIDKINLHDILVGIPTVANYNEYLDEIISSKKYWGDFELTQALLKYAINRLKSKFLKSKILLLAPHEVVNGPFGAIFGRMLSEAAIQAGGREMMMMDNIMCAAIGAGISVNEQNKMWNIYSNEWCTYIFLTFAKKVAAASFIEKPYKEVKIEDLRNLLKTLKDKLSINMPELYDSRGFNPDETYSLQSNWNRAQDNKINMIVPNSKKLEYGQWMDEYQLAYAENYESCISKGLEYITKELDNILKPRKYKK